MAPYNLPDLAVKEMKLHPSALAPAKAPSFVGKFLSAHFIDFWLLFFLSTTTMSILRGAVGVFFTTPSLRSAWRLVDFSPVTMLTWIAFAFTYFCGSYFMNHGQTYGMKLTKCRVNLPEHDARASLRWAVFSVSLLFTAGLSFRKGLAWLKDHGAVVAHDHLWRELMVQREVVAPDLLTLIPEESAVEEKIAA